MKKLAVGISVGILLGLTGWIYLLNQLTSFELPIFFSSNLYPVIEVKVNKEPHPFNLALNLKYPVYVQENFLEEAGKKLKGEASWTELDHKVHSAPLYRLPRLEIGKMTLRKVDVVSQHTTLSGSIGTFVWPLQKLNLVLDYPHRKVWGIKDIKDLDAIGLDPQKMTQLKIEYGPKNDILIPILTKFGELRMGLTTMCTGNIISSSLFERGENKRLTTPIQIVGQDMGVQDFHIFDIPSELGADGFLGYSFLSKHIIYIDAKKKILYIGGDKGNTLSNESIVKLPIVFTPSNLPITECKINGAIVNVLIDLGSSLDLACNISQIRKNTLRHIETITGFNVWGDEQEEKVYALPSCHLGKADINNLKLIVGEGLRTEGGVSMRRAGDFVGSYFKMGRPLLYRSNLYFDFPNAAMYLVDSKDRMKQLKVDLAQFEKAPYELTPSGICLKVNIGPKEMRLCLDTGASACTLKSDVELDCDLTKDSLGNSCYRIDSFQIGDSIYGSQILHPLEIASRWDFDGLLGMDFLRKHPFFIDDNFIYFKKPLDDI